MLAIDQNEISRESLVQILEIMHRLASPESMPELLKEIIEVGKVAIVADAGALWLLDKSTQELIMVIPSSTETPRLQIGEAWPGRCVEQVKMFNIHDCCDDARFKENPPQSQGFEVRSLLNVPIHCQDGNVLGVMQWLGKEVGQFDEHDEWVGPALAAQAAVAIQHSYMTDDLLASAILNKEVAVAREIQMSTLPRSTPVVEGYDLHGKFLPTDHTGGDLYDLVMLDGKLFVLLGDATGHGFGPALSATEMQAMLRVAFRLNASLDQAYMHVNNQLYEDLPDDRFITAFVGFLDPEKHTVDYHSGGQGPILHYKAATKEVEWYKPTNVPVGVLELDGSDRATQLKLGPGDVLGLISDGIYEYARLDGSEFGTERVAQIFKNNQHASTAELTQQLVDAAFEFGGDAPQADDITLVLIRRLAE